MKTYVRRYIPQPDILIPLLRQLFDIYTASDDHGIPKYRDPKSGKPLFSAENIDQFEQLMVHVKKGCLSDPPNIPLYFVTGKYYPLNQRH